MTERDRLATLAAAAGLRLSAEEVDALLPAWRRYRVLVEGLRAAIEPRSGPE